MSTDAPTPAIPPSPELHRASATDLTPFPNGLPEVVHLGEPAPSCRLDGICD